MPPSAITVCALPSSDLQTRPTFAPLRGRLDGGAQAGAAGADDEHVVFEDWMSSSGKSDHRSRKSDQMPIEHSRM